MCQDIPVGRVHNFIKLAQRCANDVTLKNASRCSGSIMGHFFNTTSTTTSCLETADTFLYKINILACYFLNIRSWVFQCHQHCIKKGKFDIKNKCNIKCNIDDNNKAKKSHPKSLQNKCMQWLVPCTVNDATNNFLLLIILIWWWYKKKKLLIIY